MKKVISFFLVPIILLCFSSCKIGKDKERDRQEVIEDAKEIVSQFEEINTRKDPAVIENLSEEQMEYFESLSEFGEETKFVAYIDTKNYTLVYTCEFQDDIVSKVMSYHIVKNEKYYNAIRAGIDASSPATVDEKYKAIKADKTEKYKAKTYEEMKKEFPNYSFIE